MNKEKIKNIVIIIESVLLGSVAVLLAIGGIKSKPSKSNNVETSSSLSVQRDRVERRDASSHFKYMSDEEAYDGYYAPALDVEGVRSATYALRGKGVTNVLDSNMDFTFDRGVYYIYTAGSVNATSMSWTRISTDTSLHVYYQDVSNTYGTVVFEYGTGTTVTHYLKSLTDSSYNSYLPLLQFKSKPIPSDYWHFIKYFYTYWSASISPRASSLYVKPYVKVPFLNLYPVTSEAYIVGYQSDNSYLRVVANMDNLTLWGKTTNYYQGTSDMVFLGDLYYDYDGDLCYIPTGGVQWYLFFYSSYYFYDWFLNNTFTSEEWNNGLYYLSGDMNLVTKYLYNDISDFSESNGNVTSLDDLRFKIYKTNLTSTTSLLSKVNLVKSVLSSGDTKYNLYVSGDDTRSTWADNTDAGGYVISYSDGGTALNFKYGLSTRVFWDNCVISCQDSYTICKYFAPYYATALIDGDFTSDGSSLTNSTFSNVFVLLGTAFALCFGWLNVEVFPGITIFGLLLVPFVVVLIIVVFRLVKK